MTEATQSNKHALLIKPAVESMAKRDFLVFKPKEILQGEAFGLKLQITNKGAMHFPGGKLKGLKLEHMQGNIVDSIGERTIEPLAVGESTEVDLGTWHAFSVGIINVQCSAEANDGGKVGFYQVLPASGKLEYIAGRWIDFLSATSRAEINQRYTNYLLVILTLLVILATILIAYW